MKKKGRRKAKKKNQIKKKSCSGPLHLQTVSLSIKTLTWHTCKHKMHKFLQCLEDVPLVEFTYLVFACMSGESYRRRLRSLLYNRYLFHIRVCVCVCVCVCARARARVCMCVSWGRGWGLGEMELRVGSNIMIHFLYILLFLIWHMYLYIIHC